MFRRRRRRRSAFAKPGLAFEQRWVLLGAGGFILIALFVFFIHQADTHVPQTHGVNIDLPNAKD